MSGLNFPIPGLKTGITTSFPKPYFILVAVMIGSCGLGCKKEIPENKPATEKKWVVTTVAGDGEGAFGDGPVLSAKFHFPNDITVAPDGTLFVADGDNRIIRKISGGQVFSFAGGSFGFENGDGFSAKFKFPTSITMDANDNLYSSDARDPRIRKISAAANVSTYAGSENEGFADGRADTARFRGENKIAADALGNVYVTDAQNNRIRKISISGVVSTIAGNGEEGFRDGDGASAKFNFPYGIAIDKTGNLFVADASNYRIRRITPAGQVSTIAGSNKEGTLDGDTSIARFEFPTDIVIDDQGNLYVLDVSRVRKVSPQGIVSTIAGSSDGFQDGDGISAKFFTPDGLGIDAAGNIYVADTNNNRIRKISLE